MVPTTSERKRKPSSTALVSPLSSSAGVVVGLHTVHGHVPGGGGAAAVVNDQEKFEVIALPARSFTPLEPPVTTAV